MAIRIIPITNPVREFSFPVVLDNNKVELTFKWNLTASYWTFRLKGQSLTDEVSGPAIVAGVDLLRPYAIRELGQLYCVDTQGLGQDPDFDNFGTRWQLVYVDKGTVV